MFSLFLKTNISYVLLKIIVSFAFFPDHIPMQRNRQQNIHGKLKERKAAGETNLTVKFLKGIPIISKNV